jgi:hypothetical protein
MHPNIRFPRQVKTWPVMKPPAPCQNPRAGLACCLRSALMLIRLVYLRHGSDYGRSCPIGRLDLAGIRLAPLRPGGWPALRTVTSEVVGEPPFGAAACAWKSRPGPHRAG